MHYTLHGVTCVHKFMEGLTAQFQFAIKLFYIVIRASVEKLRGRGIFTGVGYKPRAPC